MLSPTSASAVYPSPFTLFPFPFSLFSSALGKKRGARQCLTTGADIYGEVVRHTPYTYTILLASHPIRPVLGLETFHCVVQ